VSLGKSERHEASNVGHCKMFPEKFVIRGHGFGIGLLFNGCGAAVGAPISFLLFKHCLAISNWGLGGLNFRLGRLLITRRVGDPGSDASLAQRERDKTKPEQT
jgi:hypothetical protein